MTKFSIFTFNKSYRQIKFTGNRNTYGKKYDEINKMRKTRSITPDNSQFSLLMNYKSIQLSIRPVKCPCPTIQTYISVRWTGNRDEINLTELFYSNPQSNFEEVEWHTRKTKMSKYMNCKFEQLTAIQKFTISISLGKSNAFLAYYKFIDIYDSIIPQFFLRIFHVVRNNEI